MGETKRLSNIELLRIFSILAVVACHWAAHGAWEDNLVGRNAVIVHIVPWGGVIAVNIFVIISGYFGISSCKNHKEKILRLCIDRWFYSIGISLFMLVIGQAVFNRNYVLRAIFPVATCRHNYVTTFIFLYFFIPYLNILLTNLSKQSAGKLLLTATVIFSVMPTFMQVIGLWTNNVYVYLLWMMYIYCVGAYLRLYDDWKCLPWKVISPIILVLYAFVIVIGYLYSPFLAKIFNGSINNIFLVALSIIIFAGFATVEMPYNKIINGLASSTFAVLLIHDDPMVRNVIWKNVFRNAYYAESDNLWLHMLLSVLITYIGCVIIDKIYKYVIKRPIKEVVGKLVKNKNDVFKMEKK